MRRPMTWILALAVFVTLLTTPTLAIAHQATPAMEGETELLAVAPLDLPPAPVPIVLARITFATGSGLSMTANPGPALHFVESGSFDVVAGGEMMLFRAATGGTPVPEEAITTGTPFSILPGDLLVIPANSPFEVFNNQQEPAVALIIEMFARPPGTVFPDGIALQPLVVGEAAQLPSPPAEVGLLRTTYAPDADIPPGPYGEPTLSSVESGTLAPGVHGPIWRKPDYPRGDDGNTWNGDRTRRRHTRRRDHTERGRSGL